MSTSDVYRITHAKVADGYTVELRLSDGFVGRVDLSPALWGPEFEPLRNADYFGQVRIKDDTIRWPNGADFCPDVLRYWCEAGGVRSQEETDAHFSRPIASQASA